MYCSSLRHINLQIFQHSSFVITPLQIFFESVSRDSGFPTCDAKPKPVHAAINRIRSDGGIFRAKFRS